MSQMMLDEEEVKARETEKAGNDLGRPSIGGNEQVPLLQNLRMGTISWSVCPYHAFPAWCYVPLQLTGPNREFKKMLWISKDP
jgi:hypothetical protein